MAQLRRKILVIGGRETELRSIGALAEAVGVHAETIKVWERTKVIPKPAMVDDAGRRWYSGDYIAKVRSAVADWRVGEGGRMDALRVCVSKAFKEGGHAGG